MITMMVIMMIYLLLLHMYKEKRKEGLYSYYQLLHILDHGYQ